MKDEKQKLIKELKNKISSLKNEIKDLNEINYKHELIKINSDKENER